jgi:hypothetical protein
VVILPVERKNQMNKYEFLKKYIQSIPNVKQKEYMLNKGISEEEIRLLQHEVNFDIPSELIEFYEFSYGATLNEYKILMVPEIEQTMSRLKSVYGDAYDTSIIPFANVIGVGDFIAFDTKKTNQDGLFIIDCFHELPPAKWKGICFGLRNWLKEMVGYNFRPYWI